MHDGALEKEKEGRDKKNPGVKWIVSLLTLAEDTAEKFKGAFRDTCIS